MQIFNDYSCLHFKMQIKSEDCYCISMREPGHSNPYIYKVDELMFAHCYEFLYVKTYSRIKHTDKSTKVSHLKKAGISTTAKCLSGQMPQQLGTCTALPEDQFPASASGNSRVVCNSTSKGILHTLLTNSLLMSLIHI